MIFFNLLLIGLYLTTLITEQVPTEFSSTIEYKQGLVDLEYLQKMGENVLLIIDDMGSECGNSLVIDKLFSVYARK